MHGRATQWLPVICHGIAGGGSSVTRVCLSLMSFGGMITSRQHPTYRTRAILRLSVRHFIRASASLMLLLGARPSSAQSPTTLLPDATVLPSRAVRVRMSTAWTRADALFGDGSTRNIGSMLATDSLGSAQIPLFAASENEIRTASGLPNFRLTAGQLVAVANSRVLTAPVI